ncbi:hypothetical protein PRIPAC_82427 [Pristionchus pacificus]|uniref:Uncharacterized protein n=1 Tax=Pristionchus pacificus TaxID=54126 RepID=A0A2A6CJH1_PRIPA|nr:hypothetical protein PRIPAC_82427 [Pristionchus pacificus]|eukprot:PDM78193.1 hypothetical protein PRIPAC_30772 [Pristionchus pacificus]
MSMVAGIRNPGSMPGEWPKRKKKEVPCGGGVAGMPGSGVFVGTQASAVAGLGQRLATSIGTMAQLSKMYHGTADRMLEAVVSRHRNIQNRDKIAFATAIGFAIMGFIGFFVKLIHIPINNIIVGA